MNLPRIPFFRHATTIALAAVLAACGGGDGNGSSTAPTTQTLGGTAAVGAPIVGGSVAVSCAGGDALAATTSSTGTWTVTVSGQTLPCAVQVSGGTVGGSASTVKLHSIALAFDGTVNLTPLTDLAVAKLIAGDPAAWFAKPVFTGVDQAAVAAAVEALATSLGLATALGTTDPFTAAFEAKAGDAIDDLLEALQAALGSLSKTYAALLTAAAAGDFTAFSGFPAAIEVALGGGGGACTAGTELTYTQSVAGAPYTNGQKVCFEASTTTLKFAGKTLTDPVQNGTVTAPYSAYAFTDGALTYEVVFNDGALYEINVSGANFLGQFKVAAGGTGGALTVQVVAGGTSAPPITVDGVPAPTSEAEFCGAIESDETFASIAAGSGGTLEIVGCGFADNVGTVSASVTVGGITVDYLITYTWE
jgi:hypothetical protein